MPGRRAKNRAIGPWVDLHDLPPPPRKKKKPKHRKRLHPSFKVFLALGLMPSKARQCDPLGLRVNDAMHIMEGECDKSGGLLTGEGAPELLERPPVSGDDPRETLVDKLSAAAADVDDAPSFGSDAAGEAPVVGDKLSKSDVVLTNGDHSDAVEEDIEDVAKEATDSEDGYKPEDDVEKEEEDEEVKEDAETKETSEKSESDRGSEIVESVDAEMEAEKDVLEEAKENVDKALSKPTSPALPLQKPPESPPTSRDGSLEGSRSASPCRPDSPRKKTPVWVTPPSPVPKSSSPSRKPASPLPAKTSSLHNVKEEPVVVGDPDLRNNISTISITTPSENLLRDNLLRKRTSDKEGEGEISSGSESDTGRKRVKVERDGESVSPYPPPEPQNYMDYERDRLIQDFVSECSQRPDEMNRAAEKLQKEVETLSDLLKAKEMEWNAILRLKKLKEETLERLLRKKRQAAIVEDTAHDRFYDHHALKSALRSNGQNQLMMVPIVSSSPTAMLNRAPPPMRMPDYSSRQQRPILPKPYPGMVDPSMVMPQGRNGPVLDVKSIIADYSLSSRSRHPQDIPRRGRRVRGDPNPRNPSVNPSSLISMSNMALGSGARVRTVNESSYLNPNVEQARPGHSDGRGENSGSGNYKDVLAQFAKLTGQPSGGPPKPPPVTTAPPPPYPEVTLHPVGSRPPSPTPPSSSLLHGILTKSAPSSRPSNFSPTLARLLTAPDRPAHPIPPPPYRPQQPPRVSISDIINSSKKSRNEITITPVPGNQPQKPPKEEVILADEDDAESGDRLVIDEGADESPLQCQGCKQKSAQFVCAGCGNQWYCSRECQVTAWEEHSDVCSG